MKLSRESGSSSGLTLVEPLVHGSRVFPDRVAVVDADRELSYAELVGRCRRLGAGLRALGVEPGDRVAVLSFNSHRMLEAFLGIPASGAVVVPLNTRLAAPELSAIVEDCSARVLLADRDPGELGASFERVIRIPEDYEALVAESKPAAWPSMDEDSLAALFYTGGTTGLPKGVMLTHRNLVANAFHKTVACSLSADDVFLAAPAMFHVAGIAPLVGLLWLGARIVMIPSFDPAACLETIERRGVTVVMPVPTMLAALVSLQQRTPRDVSSLRMVGHAGSPIASELIEAAQATFPDAEIAQFYGATETSSIVTCFRDEGSAIGTELLGSCGQPVMGVAVRVVRPDGTECEPGEPGEILVRGPNVTVGYWGKKEATENALRGGWYHTGDIGVLRHGDHLFVVDRLKDMIVTGGENVYSIEVEDVLHRHPAVIEAAVFGIPDEKWGEAVHAVVVADDKAASHREGLADELRAHCRQAIAGYKVPKRVDVQTEPLPKSGPGKILKRALRAAFWQRAPSDQRAASDMGPRDGAKS